MLLQAQNKSYSTHQTLLDANLAFKNMLDQAKSRDENIDIPTVFYQDEGVPLTPTSKPIGSHISPPSPNSVRVHTTLLNANLTFKNMQGQAKSEDGKDDIHMAKKPHGSTTPPPPPMIHQVPNPGKHIY
jgi:hypothetical protein